MALKVDGVWFATNDDGFLLNVQDWTEVVGVELARLNNIAMTPLHWEIVHFIRHYYLSYQHLPNVRVFTKVIRNALGEEKGNSRYLHRLFPQGPLKYACKIAGLPKPPTCL